MFHFSRCAEWFYAKSLWWVIVCVLWGMRVKVILPLLGWSSTNWGLVFSPLGALFEISWPWWYIFPSCTSSMVSVTEEALESHENYLNLSVFKIFLSFLGSFTLYTFKNQYVSIETKVLDFESVDQFWKNWHLLHFLKLIMYACVGLCAWVQIPEVARRGHWILWGWSYRLSWVIWHGSWELNSGFLKEQQALNWAIFSALKIDILMRLKFLNRAWHVLRFLLFFWNILLFGVLFFGVVI